MLVKRYARNDPVGPPPRSIAWKMRAYASCTRSSGSNRDVIEEATAMPDR